MRTTCLVNHFQYGQYVGEAIESALGQSIPFDEIIVVDDGSRDGSAEELVRRYAGHDRVSVLVKENAGQLSCFNVGFEAASGDVVFFLDADDVYRPDYLERALAVYRQHASVDFVHCRPERFGPELPAKPPGHAGERCDEDLGYSTALTLSIRAWIGDVTSCLSMRRGTLAEILPLPAEDAWRTRADDCLVFGASLVGAKKYRLDLPLVRYRVHGSNHFAGRKSSPDVAYRRRVAVNRLFEHFRSKLGYDFDGLCDLLHREFATIPAPSWRQFTSYVRAAGSASSGPVRTLGMWGTMVKHYVRSRRRGHAPHAAPQLHVVGSVAPPSEVAEIVESRAA